ncbi:MAG: hypothetical protein HDQ99_17745 [Lachnospiraceae bacterium]|nr:hypothetical protein [Lachnospiraceae bacterium]
MRKMAMAVIAVVMMAALSSCGQPKSPEDDKSGIMGSITGIGDDADEVQEIQNDDSAGSDDANPSENPEEAGQTVTEINGDETENAKESSVNQQENSAQIENADSEKTVEELLDLFINGSINAVDSTDLTSTFYITDLNMDSEEWDSFSVGEKVDLDNDGENELVINGPYGGIYLDARDNKVYEFAVADGTALILSYTYYNGAIWIMYSNRSSAGFEFYHLEKFEGADNLVAEMNFGEELADPNNAEAGMKYTLNGAEISYDEYTELCSKILAAQVDTNLSELE